MDDAKQLEQGVKPMLANLSSGLLKTTPFGALGAAKLINYLSPKFNAGMENNNVYVE